MQILAYIRQSSPMHVRNRHVASVSLFKRKCAIQQYNVYSFIGKNMQCKEKGPRDNKKNVGNRKKYTWYIYQVIQATSLTRMITRTR